MGIKSKYTKSGYAADCGCGTKTPGTKTYGQNYCCNSGVQPAPQPCCESHDTVCKTDVCFRPVCNVVAEDGDFYLQFENVVGGITPLNANELFFYHAGPGLMRIKGSDGKGAYTVSLVDETRAGALIEQGDCVLLTTQASGQLSSQINARCLVGPFTAPENGETATIHIYNGGGIPIGATLTFTYEGNTGSYVVNSFISSTGNVYAYKVLNSGSGHSPGTIIDGGEAGDCNVAIEIVTEIDLCDLAEGSTADHFVSCLNGSPRAFTPTGPGDIPYSTDGETWGTTRLSNTDCCVVTEGAVKFSGETCPEGEDQVVIQDTNLACFEEAWNEAAAANQYLAANIDGFNVTIIDYDSGTRTVTVTPAEDTELAELVEYPAGSQICLGSCCDSCLTGPQQTHPSTDSQAGEDFAYIDFTCQDDEAISIPGSATSYWLVGLLPGGGVYDVQQLDAAYFNNPSGVGPRLPKIGDRLLMRQKVCNTSPKGCKQLVETFITYQLQMDILAGGSITVDWELGHFSDSSVTLDNGTPNPFSGIETISKASGRFESPTVNRSTANVNLINSSFGYKGPTTQKVYPFHSGTIADFYLLDKCSCATAVLWLFLIIKNDGGANTMNISGRIRRWIRKTDYNELDLPPNDPATEGWA